MPVEPTVDSGGDQKSSLKVDYDAISDKLLKAFDQDQAATEETSQDSPPSAPAEAAPETKPEEKTPRATAEEPKAKEPEPEKTKPAEEPPAKKKYQIVRHGQVVEMTEDELIENARKGFDYTVKTQEVARRAKELEDIYSKEVAPYLPKIAELRKQQAEAEDADPSLRAAREAREAKEQLANFQRNFEQQQRQQMIEQAKQRLADQVKAEKAANPIFSKVADPEAQQTLDRAIWTNLASGMDAKSAVAQVGNFLGKLVKAETTQYMQKKAEKAARAPAPKPGAPAATTARVLGRKELHNGTVAAAALARMKAAEDID